MEMKEGSNIIIEDTGLPTAKVMIVGEAPGREEAAKGLPFVGASGTLLRSLLKTAGCDWKDCYITNVVDVQPPGNDFSVFYQDKGRRVPTPRLESYWRLLIDKMRRVQPKVVLLLGAEALRAATNKKGISAWRGCSIDNGVCKCIATYHPDAVLKDYSLHPILLLDASKALRIAAGEESKTDVQIIIRPSMDALMLFLAEAKSVVSPIGFDIETIGKAIRCISLSYRKANGVLVSMSIPFMSFQSSIDIKPGTSRLISLGGGGAVSYWSVNDEAKVLRVLAVLFADESVRKVGHNSISFDAPLMLEHLGININNHWMDTMHAWHVLYQEFPKGLDFLVSALTELPNYWTGVDTNSDEEEWVYNAYDSAATVLCAERIDKELTECGLSNFYFEYVHKLALTVAEIQKNGVLIDTKVRDEISKQQRKKLQELKLKLNEMAGFDVNPNSPTQIKRLLYEKLKFPVVYKDDKVTTNEEALRRLEQKYPNELTLSTIIQYRKVSKLISTFLDVPLDNDGRMRTSYNVSGTETGRLSSSQTLWGTGMNLQNIPVGRGRGIENIRHIFVASSGCSFVKGDLSQAETRVVAAILTRYGDMTLWDKYKDPGFDIHAWAADGIFGLLGATPTKYQRDVGKVSNHSRNYGAGPNVLVARALKDGLPGLDRVFATDIIEKRMSMVPGLRRWWTDVEQTICASRTLTTCFGRRRLFFGRKDGNTFRDGYAFEPQSIVADVCNTIALQMHQQLPPDAHVVLLVHDEVVVECPDVIVGAVSELFKKIAATIMLKIGVMILNIPIDVLVGKNWRDCK